MKTKKVLVCGFAVILAFTLALTFTACGDDDNGGGTGGTGGTGGGGGGGGTGGGGGGTAPTITTMSLPSGTTGTAYSQTLAATGSTPITWSIDTGTLPGGLNFSTAGVISGTPTTVGASNFTVKASNAAGSRTRALSIGIGDMTWTAVSDSKFGTSDWINAIAYGNGKFVAVGNDGKMAYSTDNGVTWTAVADSTIWDYIGDYDSSTQKAHIEGIAYGSNGFVAVGSSHSSGYVYGKMAYSTNGINWTAITNNTFGTYYDINGIAYGNGKFVAGGWNGRMAYSADGTNWTAVEDSKFGTNNNYIYAIAYGNNKWVAGGSGGKMAYSTDNGVSWTAVSNSTFGTDINNKINSIAYGNNRFVAVGRYGKIAYSTDGTSWTAVTDRSIWSYGNSIYDIDGIAYGNNRFVAFGGGKMATSSDGANWTAVLNMNSDLYAYAIAYGNNRFVAAGSYGKMAYADW